MTSYLVKYQIRRRASIHLNQGDWQNKEDVVVAKNDAREAVDAITDCDFRLIEVEINGRVDVIASGVLLQASRLCGDKIITSEDAKKIKCDRYGVVVDLYRHETSWRCSQHIWKERENLILWARSLLIESANNNIHKNNKEKQIVVVSRRGLDYLAEVIKKVTV